MRLNIMMSDRIVYFLQYHCAVKMSEKLNVHVDFYWEKLTLKDLNGRDHL